MDNFIKGIDVSRWQGTHINWSEVKNAGYQFVFIKVTDGTAYKQAFIDGAKIQANGAVAAGLKIGYYHFAHPASSPTVQNDAQMEADYFINSLKTGFPKPHFPLVLDFEDEHISLNKGNAASWVSAFADRIKTVYPELIFYTYKSYADSHFPSNHSLGVLPLWIAGYPRNVDFNKPTPIPRGWASWQIWQYSDKGTAADIAKVDLNIMTKTFFDKY